MVATVKNDVKWLILGGNGQLGRALQKDLSLADIECLSLSHHQLDITDRSAISFVLAQEHPEVVVNAAAWTNVDLAEEAEESAYIVNAIGPSIVAEECSRINAKFVHISTDYVFSGDTAEPWQESHRLMPVSAYGRTKAEGERLVVKANAYDSFIVRTAWLYSEWGSNFVKTMLKLAIRETRPIDVVTDQIGQPTYALDLAAQIHHMMELGAMPGIYHGTNSGQTTWYEFAMEIFTLIGADTSRLRPVDSAHLARVATRPPYSVLAHQHWQEEGMQPMRNWRDALKEALPVILHQVNLER